MATVIIGGGIIGTSVAYYLSDPALSTKEKREIHIIDTSPELFASASNYAAGFLAKDWFAPEIAPLGLLSFELHRRLSEENGGRKRWGYMESTAVSLQVESPDGKKSGRGDDWLRRGASRAEVAVRNEQEKDEEDPSPLWLTKQKGGTVERISDEGSTAQVDPFRLCQFLIRKCIERGVHVHYPARAISLGKNASGESELVLERLDTQVQTRIPCTNIVLAAGVWTPQAFSTLFPTSDTQVPVTSLSGYSLLFRSPRHTLSHERETYGGKAHAVFTTHPKSCGFSPEIFSRAGAEIYIAGLNSPDIPPPPVPTDSRHIMEKDKSARVKRAAVILMGKPGETENEDDLEVIREGLCFRPWTESGRPIVAKLEKRILGDGVVPPGGVYMATGHGPWGIALSLGTGKVVAEMLAGVKTSADVSGLGFDGAGVSKL
ncbi:hypothetical protein VTO42DRAFT_6915 [Malbranchea cinnamomea]